MKYWRRILLLTLAWSNALLGVAAEAPEKIFIEPLDPSRPGEISHDLNTGWMMATRGVVVRYGDAVLMAETISLNEATGEAKAEGNVILQQAGRYWRGERLEYNFNTQEIKAEDFRVGMAPLFITGQTLLANQTNRLYTARNAFVTTDDISDPGFGVRVQELNFRPGESVAAQRATVYAGDTPVMFLPFYSRRLQRHPNHFVFTPGYRSLYGPYVLGTYRWHWNTNLSGAFHVDYRQKRGLGLGPDIDYDAGRFGSGTFSGYFLQDDDPGVDITGRAIRDDRYRIQFFHQATLRTNLTARLAINKQSDAEVVRDFFETFHRKDPQPKSFLEVNQLWPNFSLNVLAQPQLNDFFQSVERLPDVKLSAFRQQLGVSPFYYEGENSVGYFRFEPLERGAAFDYGAFRADSFHQILLPLTFFNWLNVTPRVGGRLTHYGESDGRGTTLSEENRGVFNTGAEVSLKASRIYGGVQSKFWDINELRHILQPSLNYVFVPSPTKSPRELPQFDSEIPSLRLLPIDFPDFNSIDSIDSQNVVRLALRNKLQTKRADTIDNLVNWALYGDWRIDPREDQSTFSDFYSDLDFKPRSWFTVSSEVRYDVEESHLQTANHWATLQPNDVWNVALGHRYFREDPDFGLLSGNNVLYSSLYYRFNENWGGRVTHHFEARDGVLEEQYYTLYRDLRSWTAALTFRIRDRRVGPTDYTVAIAMSLKAFPRFGLGKDQDQHSVLLGP